MKNNYGKEIITYVIRPICKIVYDGFAVIQFLHLEFRKRFLWISAKQFSWDSILENKCLKK